MSKTTTNSFKTFATKVVDCLDLRERTLNGEIRRAHEKFLTAGWRERFSLQVNGESDWVRNESIFVTGRRYLGAFEDVSLTNMFVEVDALGLELYKPNGFFCVPQGRKQNSKTDLFVKKMSDLFSVSASYVRPHGLGEIISKASTEKNSKNCFRNVYLYCNCIEEIPFPLRKSDGSVEYTIFGNEYIESIFGDSFGDLLKENGITFLHVGMLISPCEAEFPMGRMFCFYAENASPKAIELIDSTIEKLADSLEGSLDLIRDGIEIQYKEYVERNSLRNVFK